MNTPTHAHGVLYVYTTRTLFKVALYQDSNHEPANYNDDHKNNNNKRETTNASSTTTSHTGCPPPPPPCPINGGQDPACGRKPFICPCMSIRRVLHRRNSTRRDQYDSTLDSRNTALVYLGPFFASCHSNPATITFDTSNNARWIWMMMIAGFQLDVQCVQGLGRQKGVRRTGIHQQEGILRDFMSRQDGFDEGPPDYWIPFKTMFFCPHW